MSVRVLCLPRNFSVSVMRFLNWGPFLVVYKCETEDACSLCLVSCVCEGTCKGDSVCQVKEILTTRHLGCLRFSSSELHAVSRCVAVDRLNRGRWFALDKNDRGVGFFVGGAVVPPLHSFSLVYSSLFWFG